MRVVHTIYALALLMLSTTAVAAPEYTHATNSSPIAMTLDNRLVFSVNPSAGSVSIIRTDNNTVLATVPVGKNPQSVAINPNNSFAWVANAADGTVSVIFFGNTNYSGFSAKVVATITTGSEPYDLVISPDGTRIFVANSAQDTIAVYSAITGKGIFAIDLRNSICNDPDRTRHFQPRGLAVTEDNTKLYVTRFFSFVAPKSVQVSIPDTEREGLVCQIDIAAASKTIYQPIQAITLAAQNSGFALDLDGSGKVQDALAWPNQLQSIVIRGNRAFLPNIAASPSGPTQFQTSTEAFVNFIDGVNGTTLTDAGALNLHLGARVPETGKPTLFFANQWAIAFTTPSGEGEAYSVSAGSDLLVKTNVDANGTLSFTVGPSTTRFINLNDPKNPVTSGDQAGKNPRGIVINNAGTVAYVNNFVSRNVSVVNLKNDTVVKAIRTVELPAAGTQAETILAGAEVFFSTRGHFDSPAGTTVSTDTRLSQAGWQGCASCHFDGLTDSVVWAFGSGPRRTIGLNGTFDPVAHIRQRVLNYSAIFDEIEDFDLNIRNVSGPGNLATPVKCEIPAAGAAKTSAFDPNHGLIGGDDGDLNNPPCVIVAFTKANAGRVNFELTLPTVGGKPIASLTALKEWVAFAVPTPHAPLADAATLAEIARGRALFEKANCQSCHGGTQWTSSIKNFTSPPLNSEIACEVNLGAAAPPGSNCTTAPVHGATPTNNQYLHAFIENVGTFNIGVAGEGNEVGDNIGAAEFAAPVITAGKTAKALEALGFDFNHDGFGNGFSPPSLLGTFASPPYFHNGACESLACVLTVKSHRTAGNSDDILASPADQALVVQFLQSIDATTKPF